MAWTSSRVSGATRVVELRDGELTSYDVTPEEVGLEPVARRTRWAPARPSRTRSCCARCSPGSPGTERSLAVLNAGAAIYVGGGADTLEDGVRAAERGDRLGRRTATCWSAAWSAHELA